MSSRQFQPYGYGICAVYQFQRTACMPSLQCCASCRDAIHRVHSDLVGLITAVDLVKSRFAQGELLRVIRSVA
ncbi:MAG: hypothetical protein LCI00_31415 [Chloroflexi bacterium]|nr:hypothetical protein [Chloroflexota bacterium]